MAEDKPSKPGFFSRLLGVDPEKQREELAELERQKQRIRKLGEESVKRINAQVEAAQQANAKADAAAAREKQAIHDRTREQIDRMFAVKVVDRAHEVEFDSEGKIKTTIIFKWDDGKGNPVYTNARLYSTEIPALSAKIQTQQAAFGQLEISERSKIQGTFDSSRGTAINVQPYQDFLTSQALEKQFQELKQSKAGPK